MTETSMQSPGTHEPLILERLSELHDQAEYLAHYPDIRGRAVVNPLEDEVGIVDDLYVNPRDHQVKMAAITFNATSGYCCKRVLVPVEEIELKENHVRIMTSVEKVNLAPEFHEGASVYEPYYEYWSSMTVGPTEEPGEGIIRPPGRLELEGEEDEELENIQR